MEFNHDAALPLHPAHAVHGATVSERDTIALPAWFIRMPKETRKDSFLACRKE
jgi:hypothetical protein